MRVTLEWAGYCDGREERTMAVPIDDFGRGPSNKSSA